jgi:hypothetical protein
MPKVHHVKRAQQRYATRPVIDPATGEQKVVPVMSSRTGQQKLSKHGRPVVRRITERDLERPLPMPQCDYPGCRHDSREIAVGSPYKWIQPSGQRERNRHADCPTWHVWEYSSSLSARIAQIQHDGPGDDDVADADTARAWAEAKAEEIRELAEEKRESAANIEDGFGHATYQSEELEETASDLDSWADDLENVELPDPDDVEQDCLECDGAGEVEDEDDPLAEQHEDGRPAQVPCETCNGTGQVSSEEAWREEVLGALESALDECPV